MPFSVCPKALATPDYTFRFSPLGFRAGGQEACKGVQQQATPGDPSLA